MTKLFQAKPSRREKFENPNYYRLRLKKNRDPAAEERTTFDKADQLPIPFKKDDPAEAQKIELEQRSPTLIQRNEESISGIQTTVTFKNKNPHQVGPHNSGKRSALTSA